jgi:hypothetical protein
MSKFNYVTCGTGSYVGGYTLYAVKSLLKAGLAGECISVIVSNKEESVLFDNLLPKANIKIPGIDMGPVRKLDHKRQGFFFKAASLHLCTKPEKGKFLVHFDGDVLFFKDPTEFLDRYTEKTWFHHGKSLEKNRTPRSQINIKDKKMVGGYLGSVPAGYMFVEHGVKKLPEREGNTGMYIMHPHDHEAIYKLTYDLYIDYMKKFPKCKIEDQKVFNTAMCILGTDWHGGSRWLCLDHEEYFNHFICGDGKKRFRKLCHKMKLQI